MQRVTLFEHPSPTLYGIVNNPNTLILPPSLDPQNLRPFLVSGGGFDTLVCIFGWLYAAYIYKCAHPQWIPHVAGGVTFAYGQSTHAIENAMAERQLEFLNAGLQTISAMTEMECKNRTPLTWLHNWTAKAPSMLYVHEVALETHLLKTEHPLTWSHVVREAELPCNGELTSRNARFLSTAHMYASAGDYNILVFGAQGSGPDVSIRWTRAMADVLSQGGGPIGLYMAPIGTLKSVGFTAIDEAGGGDLVRKLGFSCQTNNGWWTGANMAETAVPVHCGICFRCNINALNLNRAWYPPNTLQCMRVEDAEAAQHPLHTTPKGD